MVDRIEYNVVNAAEYVAQAKVETKKAAEYQSSARRVRVFYFPSLSSVGISVVHHAVLYQEWLVFNGL